MIELRDVSFSYDGLTPALDHVSLTVGPGERVALLGPNGSGKSTLGRLANGSLVPDAGEVLVDGEREGLARLVGYVRQDPRNQIVSAVVSDEVAFGPRNLGLPREEVLDRVDEALSACGIEGLRDRVTSELSGGQQQLVAIAGVLAMHPRYLVLDEATSMLDRKTRARVARIVEEAAARGVGVLEITHRPLAAPDRAVRLEGGRLVATSSGLEVPACPPRPRTPVDGNVLSGSGLTVSYGDVAALTDVSLEAWGVTLLTGPSGAGKTTLARVLTGVLAPDAGEATLSGRPVRAGDVGLAFQRSEDQLFCETVLDDIAYGPRARGLSEEGALAAAREAAASLGIGEDLLDRSPFELSGGQMRRVALAGVVAGRPGAYVLDEPTAGLDARGIADLRRLVCDLANDGASVVIITHDPEEWLPCANAVVRLEGGRVEGAGAHA
ncbi:ABC transporter ATP-binding protein [Olsenella uli]|uniref:ATP-binding cassette domain-containing protein n=1 Tax=Olsenella uli TaxID=133926 RepID=UPI00195CDBF2|nr:ABC transporter ATP-binding protein [Olsenella uli]